MLRRDWIGALGVNGMAFPVSGDRWTAQIRYVFIGDDDDLLEYEIEFQPAISDLTRANPRLRLIVPGRTLDCEKRSSPENRPSGVIEAISGWLHGNKNERTLRYETMKVPAQSGAPRAGEARSSASLSR